jgi:hypothetical protein
MSRQYGCREQKEKTLLVGGLFCLQGDCWFCYDYAVGVMRLVLSMTVRHINCKDVVFKLPALKPPALEPLLLKPPFERTIDNVSQ